MTSSLSDLSAARLAQIQTAVGAWYKNFEKPFGDQLSQNEFLATYHPEIRWYDHAFHICRVGREAVLGLRTAFLHCNQPFRSELKALIPTHEGAVVELLWVGRCSNDIVRPSGEVAVKGTGKDFKNHVCFVMKIDGDGVITRIDEYYNKAWDEGIQETEYTVMKGSSLKL